MDGPGSAVHVAVALRVDGGRRRRRAVLEWEPAAAATRPRLRQTEGRREERPAGESVSRR